MNITKAYPPNYERIISTFPYVKHDSSVIFTYGDTLYVPNGGEISQDLLTHEKTHTVQQGASPETWWDRYLVDTEFRLSQEVEAYRNQYKSFCKRIADRNKRFTYLHGLARDLSSEIYGGIITYQDATKRIKT